MKYALYTKPLLTFQTIIKSQISKCGISTSKRISETVNKHPGVVIASQIFCKLVQVLIDVLHFKWKRARPHQQNVLQFSEASTPVFVFLSFFETTIQIISFILSKTHFNISFKCLSTEITSWLFDDILHSCTFSFVSIQKCTMMLFSYGFLRKVIFILNGGKAPRKFLFVSVCFALRNCFSLV